MYMQIMDNINTIINKSHYHSCCIFTKKDKYKWQAQGLRSLPGSNRRQEKEQFFVYPRSYPIQSHLL